jgi:hypothetical protein
MNENQRCENWWAELSAGFTPCWRVGLGWGRVLQMRVLIAGATVGATGLAHAQFEQPGTQPKEHDFQFRGVLNCYQCHANTTNGPADVYFSWQGGMMAQAARDPVFRAALAIANQDIKGVGEFCIRCHAPRAWFEGRSTAADASLLKGDDLHGVSCDVCHHLVDPLSAEAKKLAKQVPPGYGNATMVVDPERIMRGPYAGRKELKMHTTLLSPYHASSELCGNCHNVSNITLATNRNTQPPHAFGHIERTYSEWALSDFAKKESLRSCQFCHFAPVPGGGSAVKYDSKYDDVHREYFVSHNAVGGSTWVQDAVYLLWKGPELDHEALEAGKQHARELLKTAAVLGLELAGGKARITITNLTGHKLPTGYPEGRRMWPNVRFLRSGVLLDEIGRYGEKQDHLNLQEVKVSTLLDPERTRVFECKPGISPAQAEKYGKKPGASFHFILNDVTTKDNRIPPRGYRQSAFAEHLAAPVGAQYADGQYWDEMEFALPAGTDQVEVRLMFQSVSWEYLKFLVEENRTDAWSRRLYEAWQTTGKCPPEEIAATSARTKL